MDNAHETAHRRNWRKVTDAINAAIRVLETDIDDADYQLFAVEAINALRLAYSLLIQLGNMAMEGESAYATVAPFHDEFNRSLQPGQRPLRSLHDTLTELLKR